MGYTQTRSRGTLSGFTAALVLAALIPLASAGSTQEMPSERSSSASSFPGTNGKIAFVRTNGSNTDGILYVMSADGSGRGPIADPLPQGLTNIRNPVWSPDGLRLAFQSNGIGVVNFDGSGLTQVAGDPSEAYGDPTWSPDGEFIAYSTGAGRIEVVPSGGGDPAVVVDSSFGGRAPEWSPDGDVFAFVSGGTIDGTIYRVPATGGTPTPVASGEEFGASAPEWSPDGDSIAYLSGRSTPEGAIETDLKVINEDGSGDRVLIEDFQGQPPLAWSPDGTKIAYGGRRSENPPGEGDNSADIWIADAATGAELANLTNSSAFEFQPTWAVECVEFAARAVGSPAGCELPSTFVVNSSQDDPDDDEGDGSCDTGQQVSGKTECTLRAAIQEANSDEDHTAIEFDIGDGGAKRILVGSSLPRIRQPANIDATTQPGFAGSPLIRLRGSGDLEAAPPPAVERACRRDGSPYGLCIFSNGVSIRGFQIERFVAGIVIEGDRAFIQGNYIGTSSGDTCEARVFKRICHGSNTVGILVAGDLNTIGGPQAEDRNVISNNLLGGISLEGASNNLVVGNYIGVDPDGTRKRPNATGILVEGDGNVLGGQGLDAERGCQTPCNIISGNTRDGVHVAWGVKNVVRGNVIGAASDGATAIPNATGINLMSLTISAAAAETVIGGDQPGMGNLLSGNARAGIEIGRSALSTRVQGNQIGTALGGEEPLPNAYGIVFPFSGNAVDTLIGGMAAPAPDGTCQAACNLIASNNLSGITIRGAQATAIEGNVIRDNGAQGLFIVRGHPIDIGSVDALGRAIPERGNVITDNGIYGIQAYYRNQPRIAGNSIASNVGAGIEIHYPFGPDPVRDDSAQGQNPPQLKRSVGPLSSASVEGILVSAPEERFAIEYFLNEACEENGYGEGAEFIGTERVETGLDGVATLGITDVPLEGKVLTATATRLSPQADQSEPTTQRTSEFSACFPAHVRTSLSEPAPAGSDSVEVEEGTGFGTGDSVLIDPGETEEARKVVGVEPGGGNQRSVPRQLSDWNAGRVEAEGPATLILDSALGSDHGAGVEVVRTAIADPGPQATELTARVVPKKRRIVARGALAPPYPGAEVVVKLKRKTSSGRFRTLAKKTAVLGLNDAFTSSPYRKRFRKPQRGRCRLVVRFPGDVHIDPARAVKTFRCR